MMMPCTAHDDITVDDILGPLFSKRNTFCERDANRFCRTARTRFNLNSAMRGQAEAAARVLTESGARAPSDAPRSRLLNAMVIIRCEPPEPGEAC